MKKKKKREKKSGPVTEKCKEKDGCHGGCGLVHKYGGQDTVSMQYKIQLQERERDYQGERFALMLSLNFPVDLLQLSVTSSSPTKNLAKQPPQKLARHVALG